MAPVDSTRPSSAAAVPTQADSATAVVQAPKAKPGKSVDGKPLADLDVWGLTIGEGKRKVNTADGVDPEEAKALIDLAEKKPQEFMQRLNADSANGTPIKVEHKQDIPGIGKGWARFDVNKGKVHISAGVTLESGPEEYLKPYMAAGDKQVKDRAITVGLAVTGSLTDEGEVSKLKAKLEIRGLPAFSAEKLLEIEDSKERMKNMLEATPGDGNTAKKVTDILEYFVSEMKDASGVPVKFFVDMIEDSKVWELTGKEKGKATKGKATVGKGAYAIQIQNLLDTVGPENARITATGKGTVKDGDTVTIDALSAYTSDNLVLGFKDGKSMPELYRVDKAGKRVKLDDHFGQFTMVLPLAVMTLQAKNPIGG
jgi:hypothetical protein